MATAKDKTQTSGLPGLDGTMMVPGPEAIEAWQAVMTEWGRFITDRLQQDIETQREILACKSPADLIGIQTEFFQKAVQQYTAEATRLMEMAMDASNQTVKGTQSARKYDDVPL